MLDKDLYGAVLIVVLAALAIDVAGDDRSEERRVGKSVDLGGRRIIKKKTKTHT